MTVKELIEKLQEFPEDVEVKYKHYEYLSDDEYCGVNEVGGYADSISEKDISLLQGTYQVEGSSGRVFEHTITTYTDNCVLLDFMQN